MNTGGGQIRIILFNCFMVKKCPFLYLLDAALSFKNNPCWNCPCLPYWWIHTFKKAKRGGFYLSIFVNSRISPKIQFLGYLFSSVPLCDGPILDIKGKSFETPADRWKIYFSWNFRVSWRVLKKNWPERYIQLFFMLIWKYINQRERRIGE